MLKGRLCPLALAGIVSLAFGSVPARALDLKGPSGVKDTVERTESLPSYAPDGEMIHALRFQAGVAASGKGLPELAAANEAELARLLEALGKKQTAKALVETALAFAQASAWRHDYILEVGPAAFAGRDAGGRKDGAALDPEEEAKEQLRRSANLLRKVFSEHVKAKGVNLEDVNLTLAMQLGRLGNDNAEFYYRQFFRTYKNSPAMNAALLSYADFLLGRGKTEEALNTFRTVMGDKKSADYPYALLKYAWSAMALGHAKAPDRALQYKRAETALKVVVKATSEGKDADAVKTGLREKGLEALALLWAETGATKSAEEYFRANQATVFYPVFQERLADLYALNPVQAKQASEAYESLLAKFGGEPDRVARVSLKLVRLMPDLGRGDEVIPTLTSIARAWTDQTMAEGYRYQRSHHFSFAEVFERTLHGLGNAAADKARAGDAAAATLAENLYGFYLTTVPRNENTDMVAFQRASLWLDKGKLAEAAAAFGDLIGRQTAKTPLLYEAAYKRVIALDKLDNQTQYPPVPELGKAKEPIPLPAVKAALRDAVDLFVALYPEDEVAPQMRRLTAFHHLAYGHYDESVRRFEELALQYPETPFAKEALESILGLQVERGQWQDVAERSERYLGLKKLRSVGMRKKMREAMEYARTQYAH